MLGATSRLLPRAAVIALAVVLVAALTSCGAPEKDTAPGRERADLTTLVASTTDARLPRAPKDAAPMAATDGEVVHPRRTLPVYAAPGRRPFAKITPRQMGDT